MPFGWGRQEDGPLDLAALDEFDRAFGSDPDASRRGAIWSAADTTRLVGRDLPLFTLFMSEHVRPVVADGLLRFLTPTTTPSIAALNGAEGWRSDWPSVAKGVAFATDWLGSPFLLIEGKGKGEPQIGRLDTWSGQLAVVATTFADFCRLLAANSPSLLSASLFNAWRDSGGVTPSAGDCISPNPPPIISGSVDPAQMEVLPLVVWISISGQIFEQVRRMPPGTKISGVSVDKGPPS